MCVRACVRRCAYVYVCMCVSIQLSGRTPVAAGDDCYRQRFEAVSRQHVSCHQEIAALQVLVEECTQRYESSLKEHSSCGSQV